MCISMRMTAPIGRGGRADGEPSCPDCQPDEAGMRERGMAASRQQRIVGKVRRQLDSYGVTTLITPY
jgi:hypothetical protein